MALPAHVLDRLPSQLKQNGLLTTGTQLEQRRALGLVPATSAPQKTSSRWEQLLLEGDWPEGVVSELSLVGGLAGGTSLALAACRRVQQEGLSFSQKPYWCAFLDPTGSLYAPGVQRAGVLLSHLLVVRPRLEDLSRVALRLVESQSVPLVVVDLVGTPQNPLDIALGPWTRVVRRLSRAVENTAGRVILLTSQEAMRSAQLDVGLRIEVTRPQPEQLRYQVVRNRQHGDEARATSTGTISYARRPAVQQASRVA